MSNKLWKDLLHKKRTHHTNIVIPRSKYVNGSIYPEQYTEVLGNIYELQFRNQYKIDIPEAELDEVSKLDEHDIYKNDFYIIRADKTPPYKVVAISTNFEFILVYDNSNGDITFENDSLSYSIITQYPIQLNEFIGISVFDIYDGDIPDILGVTLRVDNGEPCYTVIAEFINDGSIRIVLGDECPSKLFDYYPFLDIDAQNPDFNPTDPSTYKDVDGYYPAFYSNYNGEYRDEFVTDALIHKELLDRYKHNYVSVIESFEGDVDYEYDGSEIITYIQDIKYKYDDPNTLQAFMDIAIDDKELRNRILELELELARLLSDEYIGYPVSFEEINGGRADILKNIFTQQLKDNEIAGLREKIFKENKLYGINKYIISQ